MVLRHLLRVAQTQRDIYIGSGPDAERRYLASKAWPCVLNVVPMRVPGEPRYISATGALEPANPAMHA
jgi:hypothetical protein